MEKVGLLPPSSPQIVRKLLELEYGRKRGKSFEGILNASSSPSLCMVLCGVTCVETDTLHATLGELCVLGWDCKHQRALRDLLSGWENIING